jgi:hypothetical protein
MPYSALPDRRIAYDDDGSVLAWWDSNAGVRAYLTGSNMIALNGTGWVPVSTSPGVLSYTAGIICFFPEQREFTAIFAGYNDTFGGGGSTFAFTSCVGSNDTTNGLDGTWETASMAGGVPTYVNQFSWRDGIKAVSFTGAKKVVRAQRVVTAGMIACSIFHLYGEKAAGQTPDDIIYIDHDTTPGVEYTAPEDFGDRPLATTVTRQFRVKNTSATKTANTINIQCNDADFVISTDNTTWVTTINIGSLGPGAESSTMYVRNTTPGVGNLLGPRFARIVTTVGSWT